MLRIRGLTKTYRGGDRALDGVDLDVPRGAGFQPLDESREWRIDKAGVLQQQ